MTQPLGLTLIPPLTPGITSRAKVFRPPGLHYEGLERPIEFDAVLRTLAASRFVDRLGEHAPYLVRKGRISGVVQWQNADPSLRSG
jgi:hypothetical protein